MADGAAPSSAGPSGGGTNAAPAAPSATGGAAPASEQPKGAAAAVDVTPAPKLPEPVGLPGVYESGFEEDTGDKPATPEVLADGAERKDVKDAKDPKAEPEKPAKFAFGGVEFDSQEAAEHSFKTLRGQYRAMQTRERAAAESSAQATTAALAWKAEAERLGYGRESDQNKTDAGSGEQVAGAATPEQATNPLEAIDWSLYEQIHTEHGPKVAAAWLYEQTLNSILPQVKSLTETALAPVTEREAQAQEANQVVNVFQGVAGLKYEDGSVAYPELSDSKAAQEIGYLWSTLELPLSEMGVHLAVLAYRDRAGRVSRAGAPQSRTNPTAAQVDAATAEVNAAASGVVAGAQPPASRPPATPAEGSDAALRAGIRNAGNFRSDLGFSE